MTRLATKTGLDAAAYLAWEEQQAEKHEYIGGEVFAMVGARREHVVVSGNLYAAFKQRLRGGPCQAYISDLKLPYVWGLANKRQEQRRQQSPKRSGRRECSIRPWSGDPRR